MIEWWKIDYTKNDINAIVDSIKQKKSKPRKKQFKIRVKNIKIIECKILCYIN